MAVFPRKQIHVQKKNDKSNTMESPGAQLRARLGPSTPDILVSNTTILKDDEQVVDRVQAARKQSFQDLIQRQVPRTTVKYPTARTDI